MGPLSSKMLLQVLLLSCIVNGISSSNLWCGYTQEWKQSFSTVEMMDQLSLQSVSQYRAGQGERVRFSLTAGVGGMLPSKPGDLLLMTSKVYGQLFIKHNGRVVPDSYLLVKEGHVSHVEGHIDLSTGDVLELFTGHVTSSKISRDAYGRQTNRIPGGFLEDITLCLVKHRHQEL